MSREFAQKFNLFRNTKVAIKVVVGFTLVIAFSVILAIASYINFNEISTEINIFDYITKAENSLNLARVEQKQYQITKDKATADKVVPLLAESKNYITNAKNLMKSQNNKKLADDFLQELSEFEEYFDEFVQSINNVNSAIAGSTPYARAVIEGVETVSSTLSERIVNDTDIEQLRLNSKMISNMERVLYEFMEARFSANRYLMTSNEDYSKTIEKLITSSKKLVGNTLSVINDDDLKKQLNNITSSLDSYFKEYTSVVGYNKVSLETSDEMNRHATRCEEIATEISLGVVTYLNNLKSQSFTTNAILVGVAVILGILITLIITMSVTTPVYTMIDYAKKYAAYDISDSMPDDLLCTHDEMGILANSINSIIQNLRKIIHEMTEMSNNLASSAQQLSDTTEMTSSGSDEIAKTVGEIADGATEQARNTETGVFYVSDFGHTLDLDKEHIKSLEDAVNIVDVLKSDGEKIIEELVNQTKKSNEAVTMVKDIVSQTHLSAEKIEAASMMIGNIASQTNLLALNAAIEAARAGDSGRGFAVVAEEIRKLAEDSTAFTNDINETIGVLLQDAKRAVDTVGTTQNIINSQAKSVTQTSNKFKGIADALVEMEKISREITESSANMSSKKDELIRIMENLSSISEESAASTQEISATIDEQATSLNDIMSSTIELSRLAESMNDTIMKFKV